MTENFIPARIAALQTKLAAREGKPEFAESVKAIKAELERISSTGTADTQPVKGAE